MADADPAPSSPAVGALPSHTELSGYKKTLKTELEWLRSEFKDLRTTLQMQQDDVTMSLTDLGMHLNELKNQKISRWRVAWETGSSLGNP
ncbi:uncharacterized protein [Elaeis guineensis]|uniref:uncharacterized protein n=1 Tax=Elaeis guineensis var. tenera TaxID=51953 RepID=UPI003C6D34D8